MLEIKGKCGACGVEFRRPAADRVPMGYCCRCWETAGRGSTPGYGVDGVCIDGLPCGKPANANDDPYCDLCPNRPADEALPKQGRKDDAAKPRLDLLIADMPHALEAIAMVLTRGAEKYEPRDWMDVPDAQRRYLAAGARHELEFAKGVHHDPETGEHHLAHAACCLLFRLELLLREDF